MKDGQWWAAVAVAAAAKEWRLTIMVAELHESCGEKRRGKIWRKQRWWTSSGHPVGYSKFPIASLADDDSWSRAPFMECVSLSEKRKSPVVCFSLLPFALFFSLTLYLLFFLLLLSSFTFLFLSSFVLQINLLFTLFVPFFLLDTTIYFDFKTTLIISNRWLSPAHSLSLWNSVCAGDANLESEEKVFGEWHDE